jgi:hypothetical protein
MPSRNHYVKHFNSFDFDRTSVFTSKFPVDLSHPDVRKSVQKDIPAYLDTVFLLRGGSIEEFSTEPRGKLSLHPAMTQAALQGVDGPESREVKDRHDTFHALTDGAALTTAQVQINREGGIVTDFSIAATDSAPNIPAVYELRGAINIPDADDVFEIAKTDDTKEDWSMLVDSDIAQDFVQALHEQRVGHPTEPVPIEAGLMRLLDTSSQIFHQQEMTIESTDGPDVSLSIKRRSRIEKGIMKVAAYSLIRREVEMLEDMEISSAFSLSYDRSKTPRYDADVAYLMRTYSDFPGHAERESHFERWSIHYRKNPERVYAGLAEAARRLTSFEV